MANSETVVKTEGVTKRYGNIFAVKNLDLEITRGQVFGFLGPNGSGKTTTISLLLNLIKPTAGKVFLFGRELAPDSLKRVGAVMDMQGFYGHFSGWDNLMTFGSLHAPVPKVRAEEALKMVGLSERAHSRFNTYSLGMKQRLAIALAMLNDPELLIFDEPTNGMDPEGIAEIRVFIRRLAGQGKTIFLASHLLSEVEQVCTHLAILRGGVVVKQGALREILSGSKKDELELLTSEPVRALNVLVQAGYDSRIEGESIVVTVRGENNEGIVACLAAQGIYPREVKSRQVSLEQVFLESMDGNS